MPLDTPIGGNFSDFTRARTLTPEVEKAIDAGSKIRTSLVDAVKAIITNAPPSADRSAAIRKIREAGFEANAAITHAGKY